MENKSNRENKDNYRECRNLALRYVSRYGCSKSQLKNYLERKGCSEFSQRIVDEFERLKLIDDELLAESLTGRYSKKYGRYKVYLKLLKKGIPKEVAQKSMFSITPEKELQVAKEVVSKKKRLQEIEDNFERKRKVWNFLRQRGFSSETIRKVVESKFNRR